MSEKQGQGLEGKEEEIEQGKKKVQAYLLISCIGTFFASF